MSTIDACRRVESRGLALLLPAIGAVALEGRYVVTNKGRLSRELQIRAGDVLFNAKKNGDVVGVEIKIEESTTGNLFLETWSNRKWRTPGWLVTNNADLLCYMFLDSLTVHVGSLPRLASWAFGDGEGEGQIYRYREVKQRKREQLNDTWARLVPVADLKAHAGLRTYQLQDGRLVLVGAAPRQADFRLTGLNL